MPIYEYRCPTCGNRFEKLVRGHTTPACPHCGEAEPQKLVSGFAVAAGAEAITRMSASEPAGPSPCGSCGHPGGPGSCAFED